MDRYSPVSAVQGDKRRKSFNHQSNRRKHAAHNHRSRPASAPMLDTGKPIRLLQRNSPCSELGSPNSGTVSPTYSCASPSGRQSPPKLTKQVPTRSKCVINLIQRIDAENPDSFAGARFHSPPKPEMLPKPPTHWMTSVSVQQKTILTKPAANKATQSVLANPGTVVANPGTIVNSGLAFNPGPAVANPMSCAASVQMMNSQLNSLSMHLKGLLKMQA